MKVIEIESLTKEFLLPWGKRYTAVRDVSLSVSEGEVYGLIGPNGSGKSTTLKALLGLLSPTKGECLLFGRNALRFDARRLLGYLPDGACYHKHQTGEELLAFYGRLCGLRGVELRVRIAELLKLVGLEAARVRRIGGYSKGMLQRIGLAQALINRPRLLVLDEPLAGVDPLGVRCIQDLILRLKSEGVTVLLCSHALHQMEEVCDRVGVLFSGQLVVDGGLEELLTARVGEERNRRGSLDALFLQLAEQEQSNDLV